MRNVRTSHAAACTPLAIEIQPASMIALAGQELHVLDPFAGISERDLNLLDAFYHELALDAAENPRPNTPEEDADVAWLMDRARQRMSMSPAEIRAQRARARR